jgi:hypothetical protein
MELIDLMRSHKVHFTIITGHAAFVITPEQHIQAMVFESRSSSSLNYNFSSVIIMNLLSRGNSEMERKFHSIVNVVVPIH